MVERRFQPEFSGRSAWQVVAVSNRMTEERPDLGAELARAARKARNGFGGEANVQLAQRGSKTFARYPCQVLVGRLRQREKAQGIKDRVTRHDARGASPRARRRNSGTPAQFSKKQMTWQPQLEHNVATNRYEKSNGKR